MNFAFLARDTNVSIYQHSEHPDPCEYRNGKWDSKIGKMENPVKDGMPILWEEEYRVGHYVKGYAGIKTYYAKMIEVGEFKDWKMVPSGRLEIAIRPLPAIGLLTLDFSLEDAKTLFRHMDTRIKEIDDMYRSGVAISDYDKWVNNERKQGKEVS